MSHAPSVLVWVGLVAGWAAAVAALYGRYRALPAWLTGPAVCALDGANGCQVLFRTRSAALLGVPNAALGIACYALLAIGWATGWPTRVLFGGASAALAMTVVLAWVLVRDRLECRICWTGHAANLLVWVGFGLDLVRGPGARE